MSKNFKIRIASEPAAKRMAPQAEHTVIPPTMFFHGQWHLDKCHAPEAWNIYRGSKANPVTVIVIDTGVDYTHPELADSLWRPPVEGFEFEIGTHRYTYPPSAFGFNALCEPDAPPAVMFDPMDENGHGTWCAGVIATADPFTHPLLGVVGVNHFARVLAIKALDGNGEGDLHSSLRALRAAKALIEAGRDHSELKLNVAAISCSWANGSPGADGESSHQRRLIEEIGQLGVVCCFAIGDVDRFDTIKDANNEVHIQAEEQFVYPACYRSKTIISVGATSSDDSFAVHKSNAGPDVTSISAPGDEVLSTYPMQARPGNPPVYGHVNGSSAAVPQVAGSAALIAGFIQDHASSLGKIGSYQGEERARFIKDLILRKANRLKKLNQAVQRGRRLNLHGPLAYLTGKLLQNPPTTPN